MHNINALQASFSKVSGEYDRHAQLQQRVLEDCARIAAEHFPANAVVLDLGCGTGRFAQLAHKGWRITGLDLAFGMCRAAQARVPAVVNANAESLPFADRSFDAVISSLALQWSNAPPNFIGESARVLKPGGVVLLSTFGPATLCELKQSFAKVDAWPHVNDFLAQNELKKLAELAGFKLLSLTQQQRTQHYPEVMELLRSLKNIGATSKLAVRRRGLTPPATLRLVAQAYTEEYGSEGRVPATWEILFMLAQKS